MKRMRFLLAAFLVLFAVLPSHAQFTSTYNPKLRYDGSVVEFQGRVVGTATQNSNFFELGSFDGESFMSTTEATMHDTAGTTVTVTKPGYPLKIGRVVSGDTCHYAMYIDGSYDGETFFRVDTLAVHDSIIGGSGSGTWTNSTYDFNNLKFPLYRLVVKGLTGLRPNLISTFRVILYAYKRDPR